MAPKKAFIGRLVNGFQSFFDGIGFLSEHRLWRYTIMPGIISLVLLLVIGTAVYLFAAEYLLSLTTNLQSDSAWIEWLLSGLRLVIKLVVLIASIVIAVFLYRTLAGVIVIPFLGPLLERIEIILTGQKIQTTITKDMMNALVGIWVSVKYLLVEITLLLVTIPLGPLQPVIMTGVSGYFLGRGMFDYLLEKHSNTLKQRKTMAREFWPEMEGLGVMHFICLMIPIMGPMLAPAASLTGAALLFYKQET